MNFLNLPRVLLVSELSLSKSQQGKSANPTLYNLFKSYPPELILQFIPKSTEKLSPPIALHQEAISYADSFIPTMRNRIGLITNRWSDFLNLSILSALQLPHTERIKRFSPEILLICPITLSGLIVGYKTAREFNLPFLIYFMDDWIATNHSAWIGGNVESISYYLLKESEGWIMISNYLQEELSKRFNINGKPFVVAHNPINAFISTQIICSDSANDSEEKFRVAYAGSIQSMHADALLAIAEAIYHLRKEGISIELIVYTAPGFWEAYQKSLTSFEVEYGSLIPYDQLLSTLSKSHLLLVCTSFLPENQHVVRSSLLTKLTDYMATGKPILSCGPIYSACNRFLEKWDCGLICSTQSISEIKHILTKCMTETKVLCEMTSKASNVLEENFSEKVMTQKFYKFIMQMYVQSSH
ncbi:MAG: hypothetical protein QNJ46_11080 [Leptolyngbyaceae cyanobacterium MO_188.B28]|nr:hypothetical protein [Leptolyngbyaceae cyanobacterium MO_188.B28]